MTKTESYQPRHAHYLAETQLLIRDLQGDAWSLGYHICLGGGVLNHGYSDKDIDLYLLPRYEAKNITPLKRKSQLTALLRLLKARFGEPTVDYVRGINDKFNEQAEHYVGLNNQAFEGKWAHPLEQPTCFAEALHYESGTMEVDVFIVRA